jgi:hypothetical protein
MLDVALIVAGIVLLLALRISVSRLNRERMRWYLNHHAAGIPDERKCPACHGAGARCNSHHLATECDCRKPSWPTCLACHGTGRDGMTLEGVHAIRGGK